jgi:hypothetical protein
MNVRAIALALPLVVGIAACKTSSTQGSKTASSTEPSQSSQNQSTAGHPEAGGNASASATVDQGATSGTAQGSASTGTSTDRSVGAYGSTTGESTPAAHSDDQSVTGKVARVSDDFVAIQSDLGEEKTLQLVPQTSVMLDGQDARRTDLKEGQEVRASFNTVDGKDIAVEIEAHQAASLQGGPTGSSGSTPSDVGTGSGTMQGGSSTGTGTSGSYGTGTTTTPDTTTTK